MSPVVIWKEGDKLCELVALQEVIGKQNFSSRCRLLLAASEKVLQ